MPRNLSCAVCGATMNAGSKSLPQGMATCWTCRRARKPPPRPRTENTHCRRGHEYTTENTYLYPRDGKTWRACKACQYMTNTARLALLPRVEYPDAPCRKCGEMFKPKSKGHVYCSRQCRPGRYSSRPATRARGYDRQHVRLRAELLPLAYGTQCHLCQEMMIEGQPLDLDHTPDRSGYRGMAHAHCNRADGARRRNRLNMLPAHLLGTCAACSRAFKKWTPEQTRCSYACRRLGAPRALKPRTWQQQLFTMRACTCCACPFLTQSRGQYCSKDCEREWNSRQMRDLYRTRVGLPSLMHKPTKRRQSRAA